MPKTETKLMADAYAMAFASAGADLLDTTRAVKTSIGEGDFLDGIEEIGFGVMVDGRLALRVGDDRVYCFAETEGGVITEITMGRARVLGYYGAVAEYEVAPPELN